MAFSTGSCTTRGLSAHAGFSEIKGVTGRDNFTHRQLYAVPSRVQWAAVACNLRRLALPVAGLRLRLQHHKIPCGRTPSQLVSALRPLKSSRIDVRMQQLRCNMVMFQPHSIAALVVGARHISGRNTKPRGHVGYRPSVNASSLSQRLMLVARYYLVLQRLAQVTEVIAIACYSDNEVPMLRWGRSCAARNVAASTTLN
jgi:hypothetical protein